MPAAGPLVFVVDDEAAIGQLIASVLNDEGFAVTVFNHGQDALDALAPDSAPAVVLIDLQMAGIGGEDLCRRILDRRLNTACIVMSALNNAAETAARLGVPLLRKPFDIDTLIAAVRDLSNGLPVGEGVTG